MILGELRASGQVPREVLLCPGHVEIRSGIKARSRQEKGSRWALSRKGALKGVGGGTERRNPREEPEPGQVAGEGAAGCGGQAWAERCWWGGEEGKAWVQTACMGVGPAAPSGK